MSTENNVQNIHHESEIAEIDLRRLFNAILNHIWIIAVVTILCGLISFFGSKMLLTPMYRASTLLYVTNNVPAGETTSNITSADLNTSKNLVKSYIAVLESRDTLKYVIEHGNLDCSYGELVSMISASSVNDTELLKVTVSSDDPQEAADVANAIAYVVPMHVSDTIPGSSAKVVDYAVVPSSPYSPNYSKNTVLGLLFGLLASVAVVLLIEISDITIKNDEDVKTCCNYPVLSTVPNVGKPDRRGYGYKYYHRHYGYYASNKHETDDSGERSISSFVGKNVGFAAAEAYKLLRTKLQYSLADDQKCHVFVVSSALAGEGKSITSVNLAYNLAQLNKRVLLIDGDMRRPTLAKKLSLAKYPGLSEYLTGLIELDELLQEYKDESDQMPISVITAGNTPPNPVELINSAKMTNTISALREQFDYIIMDMPPIGDVSDALVASKMADGVLLVVRQNYSSRVAVRNAVHQFEFVDAKILGVVFNCIVDKVGGYRQKKYGNRYSYYYANQHSYNDAPVKKGGKSAKMKKK